MFLPGVMCIKYKEAIWFSDGVVILRLFDSTRKTLLKGLSIMYTELFYDQISNFVQLDKQIKIAVQHKTI